jgi:sensor histidine kinase regulating citrate/malate metabolism
MSYTARVTVSFALISVMTIVVAFGVLSYVWGQHFQEYTRDNMERTAQSTAFAIADNYAEVHGWSTRVLAPAVSVADLNRNVGIQVVDAAGSVRYDNHPDRGKKSSLAPKNKSRMASAPIVVEEEEIGVVNVWVYGSDTMLTQADREYRDGSYRAMFIAMALAILISIGLGVLFARGINTLPLNVVGFLQYSSPTLALIIGVFLYGEPFTLTHAVSFSFIWLALFIFSGSEWRAYRQSKKG